MSDPASSTDADHGAPARRPNLPRREPPTPHRRVSSRRPLGWLSEDGRSGAPRRGRGPSLRGLLACLAVVACLASVSGGPLGGARAATAGAPSYLQGAIIVGNGSALALVGYVSWANTWALAGNGTQAYSQAVDIYLFNLRDYPTFVTVSLVEPSTGFNQTNRLSLPAVSTTEDYIALPARTAWTSVVLSFDGVRGWYGSFATPVSLLPPSVLNVGGLDLFALTLVSFMLINVVGGFTAGRAVMRRAVYAPKFSLLIWGHVILVAIGGAVFLDYQAIDATFAGWSPLVYPFFTGPMAFFTALSYFNRAQTVLCEQPVATDGGDLGYRLTKIRIGRTEDGKLAYVGGSWGQFWARFWGHMPVDKSSEDARPLFQPVVHGRSPTDGLTARFRARRRAMRGSPMASEALTRFPVVTPRDDIAYVAHVKGSEPLQIDWPYWTVWRTVEVPARVALLPSGETVMVRPATTRRKLTWPHYVDPPSPSAQLEDIHYKPAAAALAGVATIRDLGRVLSKYGTQLAALEAHIENVVEDRVYSFLRTHYSLVDRATSGISDEEAAEVAGRSSALLSGKREASL